MCFIVRATNRTRSLVHYSLNQTESKLLPRESFLLRTDPKVLDALRRWAGDELRSANAQLDFILRKALKDAGRWPPKASEAKDEVSPDDNAEDSGS